MPGKLRRLWRRPIKTLAPQDAYALWAATYADTSHNPLMKAEEAAMRGLMPPVAGNRVLDLACGTGRWGRIAIEMGATQVVGIDASPPMLRRASLALRAQANLDGLPLPPATFHAALCGLAIGHLPGLRGFARESARVLAPGGWLLLSDLHPAGHKAGWQRAFTAPDGRRLAVEHHPHPLAEIEAALSEAGMRVQSVSEPRVGIDIDESFSGSDEVYRRYGGLPALLVVLAYKGG